MTTFFSYDIARKFLIVIMLLLLLIGGNSVIFILVYIFVAVFMVLRTLFSSSSKRYKFIFSVAYLAVMVVQIVYAVLVVFAEKETWLGKMAARLIAVAVVLVPFAIEKVYSFRKLPEFFFPSMQEFSVISFAELQSNTKKVVSAMEAIGKTGQVFTKENLEQIIEDLPRHNSFRYISNGSLTPEYFDRAHESLKDPHLYIVISNTGSAASEVISVFTRKQYNHASLSFDRDLKTIISYNGGERVYPPGLNHEMLEFFNKKKDSSIIVYKLPCRRDQKELIIDKVAEINREGSAYNLMGLVFKYSHKPNILFCSQFVYKMLKTAGLAYFEKKDSEVKPTDLVELDYYRKLEFAYELRLGSGGGAAE